MAKKDENIILWMIIGGGVFVISQIIDLIKLHSLTIGILISVLLIFFIAKGIYKFIKNSKEKNQNKLNQVDFFNYVKNNEDIKVRLEKYLYSSEYFHFDIIDISCLVETGKQVEEGEILFIITLKLYNLDYDVEIQSLKSGIVEIHFDTDLISFGEDLYSIYNSTEKINSLFKENFTDFDFEISEDEFSKSQDLIWTYIAGNKEYKSSQINIFRDCIKLSNGNQNSELIYFTLNCIDNKDFIVFKYFNSQLKLKKNDRIQFLMKNDDVMDFVIDNISFNNIIDNGNKVYETKLPLTIKNLNLLKDEYFSNWKIEFQENSTKIIGEKNDYHSSLQYSIKYLANNYSEKVKDEIKNYEPFYVENKNNHKIYGDKCYLYLMIDTSNNFYKIGISNKPTYREKTLQSEKPTIEMVANKEFPNRKIASSFEKALHTSYDSKRIRGEWFDLNKDEVNDIIDSLN